MWKIYPKRLSSYMHWKKHIQKIINKQTNKQRNKQMHALITDQKWSYETDKNYSMVSVKLQNNKLSF